MLEDLTKKKNKLLIELKAIRTSLKDYQVKGLMHFDTIKENPNKGIPSIHIFRKSGDTI
jgi:hypothetical protein